MPKAFINGELLRWARERAAMPPEELAKKIGQKPDRLVEWESGQGAADIQASGTTGQRNSCALRVSVPSRTSSRRVASPRFAHTWK